MPLLQELTDTQIGTTFEHQYCKATLLKVCCKHDSSGTKSKMNIQKLRINLKYVVSKRDHV